MKAKALLVFALLLGVVAAGFGHDVRGAVMEMHAAQIECRGNFLVSLLTIGERATGGDYSELKDSIASAVDEVKAKAESHNLTEFREAVMKARKTFKEAVRKLVEIRKGRKKGSKNAPLREQFKEAREAFKACFIEATRGRISAEVELMKEWVEKGKNATERMKEKGFNTEGLEETLEEAEETAEELEEKAKVGEDLKEMFEERKRAGQHFLYLHIKFHSERLSLILSRIEEELSPDEEKVEEIRELLGGATEIGDDEYYTREEYEEARAMLKEAVKKIKVLVKGGKDEG